MRFTAIFLVLTLALAALFAGGAQAKELCPCSRIYKPVCASNGRTFPNLCEFECMQRGDRSLKMVRSGTCEIEAELD